jgi:hypothetical protein
LKKKTEIDNSMKTLEHIEDYLLGNLSAEEQKAFEAKLANDKELQEQVELHRILITEVQAFNAVQAAEAAYLEEQQAPIETKQEPSAKVITWNFKRIASIAACLLICIGGYNVWLQQYTISIGENMYTSSRGGSDIAALIENKQYNEALDQLDINLAMVNEIMNKIDNQVLREQRERLLFEKASIYLMQGKRTQAKEILEDLSSPKAHELLDQLHWYSPIINLFEK